MSILRLVENLISIRAAQPVAQNFCDKRCGTIATSVTVARGSRDLWKMWQTSGSGDVVNTNRGKLAVVAI